MQQPRFHRWWPSLFHYDRRANPITALPIKEQPVHISTELSELLQYWRDYYAQWHTSLDSPQRTVIASTIYYLQQYEKGLEIAKQSLLRNSQPARR
jgi:hypothetical protein